MPINLFQPRPRCSSLPWCDGLHSLRDGVRYHSRDLDTLAHGATTVGVILLQTEVGGELTAPVVQLHHGDDVAPGWTNLPLAVAENLGAVIASLPAPLVFDFAAALTAGPRLFQGGAR